MSMKVTKVDGSVDENSGLKYTVGDKSQDLLSRTIDKAWGGMQESSEDAVQNSSTEASDDTHEDPTHSPPEWGSTWLSQTASAESRAIDRESGSREGRRRKWLSRSLLLQMLQSRKSL